MKLYRIFPWLPDADKGAPGHPLFVSPLQGAGRIDNPGRYRTLYASDSATGAVAEAFGNHAVWTQELLDGPPALPKSRRALVTYEAGDAKVLDLDDARNLLKRKLRPSNVVVRDLTVTQRWALAAHAEGRWQGVRWWSFHDARWHSFGLWNRRSLKIQEVTPLTRDHEALVSARDAIFRLWED